jgi:hypothetical protein
VKSPTLSTKQRRDLVEELATALPNFAFGRTRLISFLALRLTADDADSFRDLHHAQP